MDGFRFDALARTLSTAGSRRRALVLALGGTLASLLAREESDAHDALLTCKKLKGDKKKKCVKKARKHNAKPHSGACNPNCFDRTCGPDGCGGSCGSCRGNEVCQNGSCVCVPNCTSDPCGPDGCGGMCEACTGTRTCQSGLCTCPEDECNGNCVSACAQARNPFTCKCCSRSGSCVADSDCCGSTCPGIDPTCGTLAPGSLCTFNEQCFSRKCEPDCAGDLCTFEKHCKPA